MTEQKEFYKIYETIMNLDPKIRFISILNTVGEIVYGGQREGIENYLDPLDQKLSVKHAQESWQRRTQFADKIGKSKYAMAEYEKIKRFTVPLDENHLLYLTTELEIDHSSFLQNLLKLVDTFKNNG